MIKNQMPTKIYLFILTFFLLSSPFQSSTLLANSKENLASSVAAGEKLAKANCARCHAIGLTGKSLHKDAPPFRTIKDRYPVESLEEPLAEGIVVGHKDMPEFKFAPDKVQNLINYLKSLENLGPK